MTNTTVHVFAKNDSLLPPLKPAPTELGSPPNEPGVWLAAAFNRVGRRIVFRDEDVLQQVVDPRDQA